MSNRDDAAVIDLHNASAPAAAEALSTPAREDEPSREVVRTAAEPDGASEPSRSTEVSPAEGELFGLPAVEGKLVEVAPASVPARTGEEASEELFGLRPSADEQSRQAQTEASGSATDGDAEWLDLSTRWLIAAGRKTESQADDADWAAGLDAQVAAAAPEARGSAPPPPPRARARSLRETWNYERPPVPAAPATPGPTPPARTPALGAQGAPGRHSTLSGLQPLPQGFASAPFGSNTRLAPDAERGVARQAAQAARRAEPDPWREEPSYTDARQPPAPSPSWAGANGYGLPPGSVPPWSGYAAPPWAAAVGPYGMPPWAAAQLAASAHLPPWAAGDAAVPALSAAALRGTPAGLRPAMRRDAGVEHWTSFANTWLTTLGKLALAALALHYSGLAEPILAQFGYAPAAASALSGESLAHASAQAAPSVALPMAPAAGWQSAAAPVASSAPGVRQSPAPKHGVGSSAPAQPRRRVVQVEAVDEPRSATAERPSAAQSAASVQLTAATPIAADATLRINSRPWSEVYVDGSLVGHTPQLGLRISAGSHRVRLVNPDLQLSKSFELQAAAGETVSRVELLSE